MISGLLPGPECHCACVVGTAPLQRHPTVPIFAAGSGFESRKSRRNGPWLLSSCGHSRRTPNYTTLPVQFPRLSLCLSRSVRHGRGWGRSRRLGATAPRRSSPVGCHQPTPLLRRCCRSCCRRCCRRRWWRCCRGIFLCVGPRLLLLSGSISYAVFKHPRPHFV